MRSLSIIIRADASSQIGLGHLMRCVALAQDLEQKGYHPIFVCRPLDNIAPRILSSFSFSPLLMDDNIDESRDSERTVGFAKEFGAGLVILDHYDLQEGYRKNLKDAGLSLFLLDDNPIAGHITADIILNQNIGSGSLESRYKAISPSARFLFLGEKYAMFRKDIKEKGIIARARRPERLRQLGENRAKPNLMVCFGGTDSLKMTPGIVRILASIPQDLFHEIFIILGPHTSQEMKEQTGIASRNLPQARMYVHPDISELMSRTDIAITAGGSMAQELAFFGVAPVIVRMAENQDIICKGFQERNSASVIWNPHDRESIQQKIIDLLSDGNTISHYCFRNMQLFDEKGTDRIMENIRAYLDQGIKGS